MILIRNTYQVRNTICEASHECITKTMVAGVDLLPWFFFTMVCITIQLPAALVSN